MTSSPKSLITFTAMRPLDGRSNGDDGMAWLNAYLPSHQTAAVEARLRKEARRPVDPEDDRTIAQCEADLLVAWCTSAEATTSRVTSTSP